MTRRRPAPPVVTTDRLRLVPLTAALVDADCAAYAAARLAIAAHSAGRWPVSLTREENAGLVAQHEREHEAGTAFAYALLDPDGRREIGCAYLRPLGPTLARTGTTLAGMPEGAAVLTYWLVDDAGARPASAEVLADLVAWCGHWAAAPCVLRCLPVEAETVAAARALRLEELTAAGQDLPYRWFRIG